MAADELLGNSKFYLEIDGLTDLIVQKVSGIKVELDAAGDAKAFGVTKGAKSAMQATVTGVTSATITVQFVATKEDQSLHDWYRESHSVGGSIAGGGSEKKGERKNASLVVYNQGGDDAARWDFTGCLPASYKTSKLEPGSADLFTETVEFVYETCHRVK
jgi:phage tail-like protein